jgi:hypothetical protein
LGPWLIKLTEERDKAVFIPSLKLRNLAKLPDFIRHPEAHLEEIKAAYQQNGTDIPKIRQLLSSRSPQADPLGTLHCRYQAVYGIVLTYSTLLNAIIRCFDADDTSLVEESATLVQEIIILADDATQYRPLGSSSMPICLMAAWAATNETARQARLEEILAVYQSDFAIGKWMGNARWLKGILEKHSRKQSRLLELPLEYF